MGVVLAILAIIGKAFFIFCFFIGFCGIGIVINQKLIERQRRKGIEKAEKEIRETKVEKELKELQQTIDEVKLTEGLD